MQSEFSHQPLRLIFLEITVFLRVFLPLSGDIFKKLAVLIVGDSEPVLQTTIITIIFACGFIEQAENCDARPEALKSCIQYPITFLNQPSSMNRQLPRCQSQVIGEKPK